MEIPAARDESSFTILQSSAQADQSTPISPDVATCSDCLRELCDNRDRRYRYPFINCTGCGPRFTIIKDIPYDRPLTTMKSFVMCSTCQQEYDDPSDRRFHAQPNACRACGPRIWFVSSYEDLRAFEGWRDADDLERTLDSFQSEIDRGGIVAVKGIGGFHLACDANNENAIDELRARKGRIDKPFALLVADMETAWSFAVIGEGEQKMLQEQQRPIVLLRKRDDADWKPMLDSVAPGNDFVGVMLPYSPLHYLIAVSGSPLVMTSGNVSDEPIVRTNLEARQRLAALADSFLLHDREIHSVCDDSVVRMVGDRVLPIRRSRGYAPLPVSLGKKGPGVLAVGGELKATFCVCKGSYAYVSQHIGDMGNVETLEALRYNIEHFLKIFRVDLAGVAADLHPGYLSTSWAKRFADSMGVPLIGVQHHFAHAASLIAETPEHSDEPLIACCFDGTGYGTDGAIWGGEFLIATSRAFTRAAHLQYFPLPGGDASIRRPYRTALANLWANDISWDEHLPCTTACPTNERSLLKQQLAKSFNCSETSSMGRLFDAVASLIGLRHEVTYEAQAAMELEAAASGGIEAADPRRYAFEIRSERPIKIGCKSLMRKIAQDVRRGEDRHIMAAAFHHAVANMVVDVAQRLRSETGIRTVGLTGGVFQNVLLAQLVEQRLAEKNFATLQHQIVPPNDGGLALGQAVIARCQL